MSTKGSVSKQTENERTKPKQLKAHICSSQIKWNWRSFQMKKRKYILHMKRHVREEKTCTKILLQDMQYLLKSSTDKEVLVVEMAADIVLLIKRMFHSAKGKQNLTLPFTFSKSKKYILDEVALGFKATMPSAGQMNSLDKNSICAGCGLRIIERFYLMAVDRAWHIDCLKCSECDLRLDNELTCFSKDGLILCRDDYYKRFSVQKCSACGQGITSKELVMRAREHVYHVGCFACDRCKRMLATGEYFGMRGMRIYCKEDYEELLREESRSGKTSSSSKGRPRKRRLASTIESVSALAGFTLGARPEDLNGVTSDGRPKRVRTSFKHHQLRAMKAYFAINHNPDAKDLKQLSQKTGLTKRVLQVWFQNARAKFRRTVCNSQSPMSPSCEQLTSTSTIVETPGA